MKEELGAPLSSCLELFVPRLLMQEEKLVDMVEVLPGAGKWAQPNQAFGSKGFWTRWRRCRAVKASWRSQGLAHYRCVVGFPGVQDEFVYGKSRRGTRRLLCFMKRESWSGPGS
ncbi:MAG: hypothetical protein ACLTXL_05590 [Clostridia bacterium]